MIKRLLASLSLFLVVITAMPVVAHAWSPFSGVDCSGKASTSAVCTDQKKTTDPVAGSQGVLLKIVNLLAIIAGIAAVIIIIIAGLKFVQSGGNSESVTSARRTLIYASVGLIVILLARALIGLALGSI